MKAFINVHNILSLVQYCLFEPNKGNYLVLHINTINIQAPFKQHWLVSGLSENRTSVSLKVQFRSTSVYLYADKKHRLFRNMMDVDDDHESVFMFQNEHWVDSPRGRWENYDCHWFGSGTNNTRFHLGITIIGKYLKWPKEKLAQGENGQERKWPWEKPAQGENGPAPF